MNIYKITLKEDESFFNFSTYYGVADSIEDAMAATLEIEKDSSIDLKVRSAEVIAECSFNKD